jgi:ABC-2 type transport system ATP-binding protein
VTAADTQEAREAAAPPAATAAIRTQGLRKTYKSSRGDVDAVRGIDLDIPAGEFFGLLGPNGAGKSTTIGMLTTLVAPTGGRAWVAGFDVVKDPVAVKRRIGVVTQNNTLDMQLTVTENLAFRSRFFGLPAKVAARRAAQLIDAFGLGDRRNAMADQLSGGQARRLLIARALVHRPDVLFLDEPTAGLDPQTRVNLWEILKVLHDQGQTVLLTTHYMEEAEALCDRIAVVDHGLVLAQGTQEQLMADAGAETIMTIRFEEPVPPDFAQRSGLGRQPGISRVEPDGDTLKVFSRDPEGLLGELVSLGAAQGLHVLDASQAKPSLETVFLTLTGREYRE